LTLVDGAFVVWRTARLFEEQIVHWSVYAHIFLIFFLLFSVFGLRYIFKDGYRSSAHPLRPKILWVYGYCVVCIS